MNLSQRIPSLWIRGILPLLAFLSLFFFCSLSQTPLIAEEIDPEEDDYPPGLLATCRAGGKEIQRIDADVAFDWGEQAPLP